MSKVKETIKIILVMAVLAVGVFFGVNYLLHPQNESATTTPTTTKKTTATTRRKSTWSRSVTP
ncbi:hypothetical protein OFA97_08235 [Lactiplantibacillus plantarum]|nr:hypothetical protein OFA97_08235 [Lactiplantibacillus plantarum]